MQLLCTPGEAEVFQDSLPVMHMEARERIVSKSSDKIAACERLYYDICDNKSSDWLEVYLYYSAQADLFEYWFNVKIEPFNPESIDLIAESNLPASIKEACIFALNADAKEILI